MIWALPLLPALCGLAIWAVGGGRRRLGALGMGAAGLTFLLALASGGETGRFDWAGSFALTAALPPVAQAVALTVPAIAFAVLLFAAAHEDAPGLPRLTGLLLLFIGGMELVVVAADLVTLLIGWEIVGACSWALIGHRWRDAAPGRSANYAFVMTRTGDLGLFVALFVTVTQAGGAGYDDLAALEGGAAALAAAGILVAAVSKAGQLPFAPWLFRAMDGPTAVSALLHSATMVAAGVYLLARLHPRLSTVEGFGVAAMAVGLATAILGGIVALRQMHAKKVLAGSTSAQMGLMIAAVGAGYPAVAVLHLIVHAATKAALFFAAGIAHGAVDSFDLRRMRLGRAMPVAATLTAIAALSLAAVPPLAGGWSKEEILKALEHAGPWVALAGIVAGGLSAAYAARFAWLAFAPGETQEAELSRAEGAALGLLACAVLALSALWLPPVHDRAAALLGAELPSGGQLGLIASLTAVALGVLAGLRMARAPGAPPAVDWLGLPGLIESLAEGPFDAVARAAARADDRWLDLIPRAAAAAGRRVARGLSTADNRGIDGLTPGAVDWAMRGGVRVWRGGVGTAVLATGWLSRRLDRGGEALSDLLPNGSGRLVGMAGADLRRLQTGLSHHYYVVLLGGAAAVAILLIIGA